MPSQPTKPAEANKTQPDRETGRVFPVALAGSLVPSNSRPAPAPLPAGRWMAVANREFSRPFHPLANTGLPPKPDKRRADTVSEFVSQKAGGVGKNSCSLKQIVLDFIGDFAILLVSDSMQQTVSICG